MRVLELFSGTESFSKEARAIGHETFTIESNPSHKPDLVANILEFNPLDLPWRPDIIWASPPCTAFSVASIGHHWTGGNKAYIPKTEGAKIGLKLLERTIKIIKIIEPKHFYIENPRGLMRKMDIWETLPCVRRTVTYCQYGDTRMKPTDIWTNNLLWIPRTMCKNGDPCHVSAPRGSRTGTQGLKGNKERSIIPAELCKEILRGLV